VPVRLLRTAEVPPELLAAARDLCDQAFAGRFHDTDWDHALGGWHGPSQGLDLSADIICDQRAGDDW
jgi:hypothetical protein